MKIDYFYWTSDKLILKICENWKSANSDCWEYQKYWKSTNLGFWEYQKYWKLTNSGYWEPGNIGNHSILTSGGPGNTGPPDI